jgi:hypothetical protein
MSIVEVKCNCCRLLLLIRRDCEAPVIYLFKVYFTILSEYSEPGSISRFSEKVTGWMVRVLVGARVVSLLQNIQAGSEVYPVSY